MGNCRFYSTLGSYLIPTQFLAPWPLLKRASEFVLKGGGVDWGGKGDVEF
jgi:hypothetical protein